MAKTKLDEKSFLNGFIHDLAYGMGTLSTSFGEPGLAKGIIKESGYEQKDFMSANLDPIEKRAIKKIFREG